MYRVYCLSCQICATGHSPWASKEPWGEGPRRQSRSFMMGGQCKFHVCSVECWQVLHGFYKGEWGLVPPLFKQGKGKRGKGQEGEEGEEGGEGGEEEDAECFGGDDLGGEADDEGEGEGEEHEESDSDDSLSLRELGGGRRPAAATPRVVLKLRPQAQ